jgi:hypothetical protein
MRIFQKPIGSAPLALAKLEAANLTDGLLCSITTNLTFPFVFARTPHAANRAGANLTGASRDRAPTRLSSA